MLMKSRLGLLTVLLASASAPALAAPPAAQTLISTPELHYLSADGLLETYTYQDINGFANFWSTATGNVFIGDLAGGADSASAFDVDPNGLLAAGVSEGFISSQQPFYWTAGTGIMLIPTIPGGTGQGEARAVSDDATTIVGWMINGTGDQESFYWTAGGGTVALGFDPGWVSHIPRAVSDDGSAIAGSGTYLGNLNAYHWDALNGMTAIPLLPPGLNPSAYNEGYAISGDGTTVVGYNEYQATGGEGFIWSQANGVTGLGFLGGDTLSSGTAVNHDGSIAYGYSFGSGPSGPTAFQWTSGTGPVSMNQIMSTAGIDMTNTHIEFIWSASDDGTYVSGNAYDLVGLSSFNFIANLNAASAGITTPSALAESIASMPSLREQSIQKSSAQLGQSLFAARLQPSVVMVTPGTSENFALMAPSSIAPAAGDTVNTLSFLQPQSVSGFVVGSLVAGQNNDLDNWGVNGLAGFKFALSRDFTVGVGINGSATRNTGIYDSHSDLVSKGASMLTSYQPAGGLRLYTSLFGAMLDIDTHRGYDAGAIDYSEGSTNGYAFGGAARIGWNQAISDSMSFEPYLEAHLTHVSIDAYTERGGSFPARFSEQSETSRLGKLGIEGKYQYSPTLLLSSQVAYVHAPSNNGTNVTTSAGGLTFVSEADHGDSNWGELTLGAQWSMTDKTHLSAEISGRSSNTHAPQATATVGLTYNF